MNCLPRVVSNCDPHDLKLSSSSHHRCEPPSPKLTAFLSNLSSNTLRKYLVVFFFFGSAHNPTILA
jgi:hypothetical protein